MSMYEEEAKRALSEWASSKYAISDLLHVFDVEDVLGFSDAVSVDWMRVFNGRLHWYYEGYNPYIYSFDGDEVERKFQLKSPDMGTHGSAAGESCIHDGYFFKGFQHYAPVLRIDEGDDWTLLDTPFDDGAMLSGMASFGGDLYLGGANWPLTDNPGRIYRSTDDGESWSLVHETTANDRCFTSLRERDGTLVAFSGQTLGSVNEVARSMWTSTDGTTWSEETLPDYMGSIYAGGYVMVPPSWAERSQLFFGGAGRTPAGTASFRGCVYMWDGTNFVRLAQFPRATLWNAKPTSNRILACIGAKGREGGVGRSYASGLWEIDVANLSMSRLASFRNAVVTDVENFLGETYVGLSFLPYRSRTDVIEHTKSMVVRLPRFVKGENPPLQVTLWDGESISAGDSSPSQIIGGWEDKTIYFETDTAGTLTIEINPDGSGWRTYDTVSFSADEFNDYSMTGEGGLVRLSFDTAATVSGWIYLR